MTVLKFRMIKRIVLGLLFLSQWLCAQETGYWDNIRVTNETVTLKRNEKKIVKSADFPVGTTEIVFRITSLDDNQKISSSLVSVLKSVPDPTGISQGSAGAVFLASTIAGDDKFKYAVFISAKEAEAYVKNEKSNTACYSQTTPVNKDAKLLNTTSGCLSAAPGKLWLVLESDNWFLNHKLHVEIVPWVDFKQSKGWNTVAKQDLVTLAKSLNVYTAVQNKDVFSGCFLERITSIFTYNEYKELLTQEKQQLIEKNVLICLEQINEKEAVLNVYRNEVTQLQKNKKYNEAITLLEQKIITSKTVKATDYNSLGYLYLITRQYQKALQVFQAGEKLDEANLALKMNLAHVYLFLDKKSNAKAIHKKYENENISVSESWKNKALQDIKTFEALGFDGKLLKSYKRFLD